MISAFWPLLGFGLILYSSMLNRGLARSWQYDDAAGHAWPPDQERSYLSRMLGFMAGPPAFVILLIATIRGFGWWTLAILPAGWLAAFIMNLMLLGGSPARVARRMRAVRLPVVIAAIVVTIGVAALID